MFSRKTAADFFGGAEEIISRSDGSRLVNANKKAESYQSKTLLFYGATGRIRTGDLLITNQLLYQLSHSSRICIIYIGCAASALATNL